MPDSTEAFKDKILDIEEFWQFPCCWAAVDGCNIPIDDFHNGGRSARPGENSMKTRSQRPGVYRVLRRSDEGAFGG